MSRTSNTIVLYRTFANTRGRARKLYSYVNYLKLRREERAQWRAFHGCTVTLARDEQLLRRACPAARTAVVPNAVDTDYFRPMAIPAEPMSLVFFGSNNYFPNADGLAFFLTDIMPLLRRRYPRLKLFVVGHASREFIDRWSADDVVITGVVDDVRPYLARTSASIVPLRIGGGRDFKILEGMAMGRPVVSTRIGAEGLAVVDERDILLADTATAFAAQISRVFDDAGLAGRLGSAARRLVEEQYDWRASTRVLDQFYASLLAHP